MQIVSSPLIGASMQLNGPVAPTWQQWMNVLLMMSRIAHPWYSAGFDVPTPGGTTGGGWSPSSFGHLGYTGTAFWVDPGADRAAILITNRSWPDDSDRGIADLRRQFFGAVARLES